MNGKMNRILLATILGSGVVFLDGAVSSIILPRIQETFHRGLLDLQWVMSAYGVTISALLLLGGALGDRYGRRRIFLAGLVLFSLASIACAMSPSFWGLVAARAVQGIGGALLTPESLAIINATFSRGQKAKAIGIWSAASSLTGVIGPPLAGWIAEMGSWRAVFLINLPMTAAAGYLGWISIPENCAETRTQRFDLRGSILAPVGLGLLVYGIARGLIWALAGVAVLGIFGLSESRASSPVLPLNVFKNRMFSRINLMTFFLYTAFAMVLFYLPSQLIRVEHYTAAETGLALTPIWFLIAALSRPVSVWMLSLGTTRFLIGGSLLVALACITLSFTPEAKGYLISYFPGFLLMGLGFGLTTAPLTSRAISSLSSDESGLASGFNNAVSRISGVVGVALAAGLLTWSFRGVMGSDWKKDPLMGLPAGASVELRRSVDAARRLSFKDLLWASALMSIFSGLMVTSDKNKT